MTKTQTLSPQLHERFPLLAMTISMDDESLSGIHESPRPCDKRLANNARAWLQACAAAHRLINDNGSAILFQGQPLDISITHAHIPQALADIPSPVIDFSRKIIAKTAFEGARALFSLGKAVSQASAIINAAGLPSLAQEISKLGAEWLMAAEDRRSAVACGPEVRTTATIVEASGAGPARVENRRELVVLPALTARSEFNGFKNSHMSASEFALHIVSHEAGHVAQTRASADRPAVLGGSQDAKMEPLFEAMGLLRPSAGFLWSESPSETERYAHLCTLFFQESYADCFSVLTRASAARREDVDDIALATSAYRGASFPTHIAHYGASSMIHDTREALFELRERLAQMSDLPRGEAIGALCVECSQMGMIRWAQNIALNRAGPASLLLWSQSAERASDMGLGALSQEDAADLLADVNELKAKAMRIGHLASAAAGLAQKTDNVAGHGLALGMLVKMSELAGAPRCALEGAAASLAPRSDELHISKRIEALREACFKAAPKMPRR